MSKVLLTRPQKSSLKIATKLSKKNIQSLIQPLFSIIQIENLPPITIKPQAILITSPSAVFALKKMSIKQDVLILAVGQKTALEVKKLGYKNVNKASDCASSLFNLATTKTSKNNGLIIYLSGEKITSDLAEKMQNEGFEARRIVVYKTKEIEELFTQTISEIKNKNISEIWFYSQNTLNIFYKLAKKHNLLECLADVQILCLSDKIANLAITMNFKRTQIIK